MSRPLTDQQASVYEGIRRVGRGTLEEINQVLPSRLDPPSRLLRVVEALTTRGLVHRSGNAAHVYSAGVVFTPAEPTTELRPKEEAPRTCSECGLSAFHYIDDRLCVHCRLVAA